MLIDRGTQQTLVTQVDTPLHVDAVMQYQPAPYTGAPVVFYRPAAKSLSLYAGSEEMTVIGRKIVLPPGTYTFRTSGKKSSILILELKQGDIYSLIGRREGPELERVVYPADLLLDRSDALLDLAGAAPELLQRMKKR